MTPQTTAEPKPETVVTVRNKNGRVQRAECQHCDLLIARIPSIIGEAWWHLATGGRRECAA